MTCDQLQNWIADERNVAKMYQVVKKRIYTKKAICSIFKKTWAKEREVIFRFKVGEEGFSSKFRTYLSKLLTRTNVMQCTITYNTF